MGNSDLKRAAPGRIHDECAEREHGRKAKNIYMLLGRAQEEGNEETCFGLPSRRQLQNSMKKEGKDEVEMM